MKKLFSLLTLVLVTGLSINSQLINKTNINTTVHSLSLDNHHQKLKDSDLDNQIKYQALNYDKTSFSNDVVSNEGYPIIIAKAKDNISQNSSGMGIIINTEINKNKSYYIFGKVENNKFIEKGRKVFISEKQINIIPDGIYCLHITDNFNNEYTSFLELGKENWKLNGDFDIDDFNILANLLNVTFPSFSMQNDQNEADQWLHSYQIDIDAIFRGAVNNYGRGFDIPVTALSNGYKSFLDPITYVDDKTQEAINQEKLITEINDYVLNLITSLTDISEKLNINTTNVVDKWSLDDYSKWINGYNDFMNRIKSQLINDKVVFAGRGYASEDQIKDIFAKAFRLSENIYLKPIIWNKNLDNKYKQDIDYEQLQAQIINLMNQECPEVIPSYNTALQAAETNLNLHGYSIPRLLEGQEPAQSKSEIANYQKDLSFHNWLQQKADDWFHDWQLKMGLGIGVPLFAILVASGGAYWRHHYNKYAACGWRKKLRPIGWEPSRRVSLSFNFWDAPKKKHYPFKEADDVLSGKEQVKSETNETDKAETKENQNLKEKQLNQENEIK